MRSGAADTVADIGMRALATLDKDATLAVCFRCHALKDQVRPDYLAGAPIEPFYSVKLPLLSGEPILPDGRIRTFAYQQGLLFSVCYLNGSMTCVDCHEPHSQEYRDANGAPLPGRFDDGQCTSCHVSKAAEPARHTHHAPGSEGSRCVSCHMPYLQEGDVGSALRYARSDHAIPVPRPAFDAGLGIEPACQSCHRDRTVAALQATVDTCYGETKPHPPLVAALTKLRGGPDANAMRTLVETRGSKHAMADFTALAAILRQELTADMPSLDAGIEARFRDAARSDDPDIVALALAALHYARGSDAGTRRWLAARLDSLGGAEDLVRSRWVVLLGFLADGQREAGDARAAIATYGKALEIRPNDARVLVNLGLAHAAAGDLLAAEQAYVTSLANGPPDPLTLVNLGIARAARGDGAGAVEAYTRASEVDPADALPYFNLGNLYLRAQRVDEAIEQYRRATAADPALPAARFNLARALASRGEFGEAKVQVEEGLRFAKDDSGGKALLAQIEQSISAGGSR
jgi:tetratricopeptide (TPR) repeat protein